MDLTPVALAVSFLGVLAFAAFVLWQRRDVRTRNLAESAYIKAAAAEDVAQRALRAASNPAEDLSALRETVSTLSLRAGLEPNRKPHPPKG